MKKSVSKPSNPPRGRSRAASALVLALAAQLVLLPALPAAAAAAPAREATPRAAPPTDVREPMAQALAAATFRRAGSKHTLRGASGIKLTTTLGRWRAERVDVRGARVKIDSPWGEELNVDLLMNDAGLLAVFNERIQVLTTFDANRNPLSLEVAVGGETTTTFLGNRARLIGAGAPISRDLDRRAHEALALALDEELSPAFRAALAEVERPAENAGCALQLVGCIAAISTWIIDTALLPAACLVAGVPTFGISCALAVIGHELASAGVAISCGQYADCRNGEENQPIDPDQSTPIILDMDGRGFRLTGLDDPVVFDLTADGEPDRVSWTARDSDEAFLVLDRNRNGRIDHGGELFGGHTPLVDGTPAENGFLALNEYDLRTMGGNENGSIDAGDRIYSRLMLWTDRNRDGVSSSWELTGLRQAGVVSMSLDYRIDGRRDRHGNEFVYNSKAIVEVRNHRQPRAMSDVYLRIQQ